MNLLVIHEQDLSDNEKIVIGVAGSVEEAEKLIKEYYGKDLIREVSYTDIRNSNLEYSKVLEIKYSKTETHPVGICLEWFELNKI